MSKTKKIIFSCMTLWLLSASMVASSHALKETTATITLRSGQLDVLVNTNFSHWLALLHNNEAWLLGDTERVLLANQTDSEKVTLLKELILQHTNLSSNGMKLNCKVSQFPSKLSELQKDHHKRAYFRLGCKSPTKKVTAVSLSLPKSLGRVYVSLVQPKQQVIGAGQKAVFKL
ncbi:hypothetical protein [Pseudoalteromonas luteoviolacea]|uniref:Uncharacterized protein n=1 Tax=Pseudoalteromonas luteoviolacea S4060-1 TaxID=1365257 RepID=A0A162BUU9_9GAMM|nr:hypothetical protein [Pseudoalteromonas luteoviolacea]KZN68804.1 hypothetical protein N478_14165 [Pseudoalteromonas luteoviolacea S4060-1]